MKSVTKLTKHFFAEFARTHPFKGRGTKKKNHHMDQTAHAAARGGGGGRLARLLTGDYITEQFDPYTTIKAPFGR